MEEKNLNAQESLEIITRMIQHTRRRLCLGSGNVCLLWGYTSVAVALLVWVVGFFSAHPGWNFLWFLIWIVGGTLSRHVERRSDDGARSYTDRISHGLWSIVGYCVLMGVALCLGFMLFRGANCWVLMLIFGLFVIGFAASMQGVILAEKSLMLGGGVGMLAGGVLLCCALSGVPLLAAWIIPLFMFSFVCMMIVPGHILNHKARKSHV
ncbi:MAG: hypothetical protein IJ511_09585 [Bacteroides sp.]|nr:hypothetical protein [Bacteroides sp.]